MTFFPSFFGSSQVGVFYWTIVQTLNYNLIKERNRVPMVSLFGLVWTTFLAYMKQKEIPHESNVQHIQSDNPEHSSVIEKSTNLPV